MSGWIRAEADDWEASLAELQAGGVPLPTGLAILDLRWWADRILAPHARVCLPSERDLAARWGWGRKRVRLLLADEERWCDPRRLVEWRAHPTYRGPKEGPPRGQRGTSEGPSDNAATPAIGDKGPSEGPAMAQRGPTRGDTRGGSPYPHPSPSPPERESSEIARAREADPGLVSLSPTGQDPPDKPPPAFEEAARVALQAIWGEEVADLAACTAEVMLVRTLWVARGRPDPAALGADVVRVARWAQEAPDSENDLRGRDSTGAQWAPDRSRSAGTLLNVDRFGDRLRAAVRWERQRDGPGGPARSRRRDPRRELTSEQLAEGERALEQLRQQRAAQEAAK